MVLCSGDSSDMLFFNITALLLNLPPLAPTPFSEHWNRKSSREAYTLPTLLRNLSRCQKMHVSKYRELYLLATNLTVLMSTSYNYN